MSRSNPYLMCGKAHLPTSFSKPHRIPPGEYDQPNGLTALSMSFASDHIHIKKRGGATNVPIAHC